MRPKTLSASSIHVAELCLSRWRHEMLEKPPTPPNPAAQLGTVVHNALENYVRLVYMEKAQEPDINLLRMFYVSAYSGEFGFADEQDATYLAGLDMIENWFKRTTEYLNGITVLSVESKQHFELPTSLGKIQFNYIFDRLDETAPGEYRVIDYKTSVFPVTADDLPKKIQVRVYALAVNMMFPEAKKIWVQYDMLRHSAVGRVFEPADNRATYRYLKSVAETIIATDENNAPETLNPECRFCIKVTKCEAVRRNVTAGGHVAGDLRSMIDEYALLRAQRDALNEACRKLEQEITSDARENEWTENEGEEARVKFSVRRMRDVDADRVQHLVPRVLWDKYGSSSITLKDFEAMLRDKSVDPELKKKLQGMVGTRVTTPSLKIEFKKEDT